jgi:hypothetical protein
MRSSPADLVLSHAASSGEPHFFPPSSFPYPRLLPVVVFARSNRSSTRRELDVTLPPALSPRAWVTSSMRRTPSTEAHLDLAPLMFPLGCRILPGKHLHKYTERRKAEDQLLKALRRHDFRTPSRPSLIGDRGDRLCTASSSLVPTTTTRRVPFSATKILKRTGGRVVL